MLRVPQNPIDDYASREGITLVEVARRLSVSAPTVTNIRIRKYRPSLELAIRMRDLFGLSTLDEVYGVERPAVASEPEPAPPDPEVA